MPYKKTIKHMPLNYKKNHSSQTENKNKRKKSLKADINSRTASACNNIYNNDDRNTLLGTDYVSYKKCRPKRISNGVPDYAAMPRSDERIKDVKQFIPGAIQSLINTKSKSLLRYLNYLAGKTNEFRHSVKDYRVATAVDIGRSVETVTNSTNWLAGIGIISKERDIYYSEEHGHESSACTVSIKPFVTLIRFAREIFGKELQDLEIFLIRNGLHNIVRLIKNTNKYKFQKEPEVNTVYHDSGFVDFHEEMESYPMRCNSGPP